MCEDFERDFASISVAVVKSKPGFNSCLTGSPTKWNPDEYAMIIMWTDEDSLAAFAGED